MRERSSPAVTPSSSDGWNLFTRKGIPNAGGSYAHDCCWLSATTGFWKVVRDVFPAYSGSSAAGFHKQANVLAGAVSTASWNCPLAKD